MDDYELTPDEQDGSKPDKLPLWKTLFERMKTDGEIVFGKKWPVKFFEDGLRLKKEDKRFAFSMIELRQAIELEFGYYIRSTDSGEYYQVLEAEQHEPLCQSFDSKMRRYCVRSINFRSAILMDEKANLSPELRAQMESNLEKAQRRLVLMARQATISKYLIENAPELMQ